MLRTLSFYMKTEQTLPTEKITANSEQLAVLKSNFPQCFDKQGKFIVSKLQEILQADGVDLSRESYSLNWLGKSYARVLANEPIRTMLSEDTEHNQQEQNKNSHNLLIQGDNLEVLKHLKGAYTDKIKMIYIDPPYNTGSDGFVYQDDRSFTPEQFAELAGVDLDEAKRVLDFTQSNANSHSAWLTFIYPRLYIAKQLLKDDGIIFISIDDNEQAQLKILCDEVFGEQNFINQFVWKKNSSGKTVSKQFPANVEYVFMYSKLKEKLVFNNVYKPLAQSTIQSYSKDDNDGRGKYCTVSLQKTKSPGPETTYDYTDNTGKIWTCPAKGWRMVYQKVKDLENDGRLYLNGDTLREKSYWNERENEGQIADTLWDDLDEGNIGTTEVAKLIGKEIFDNPKPIDLISRCLKIATNHKDMVLDFFAGSGTTAHAVLKQNAEDGGNRQFICVQIAEQIEKDKQAYKAGYRTIFGITKERIIKASEKLAQEYPEIHFDRGFKIFKTCENFLPSSSYRDLKQLTLEQTNTQVVTTGFADTQLKDILTTWKGLDKILLSENLNAISLGNYLAYGLGHVLYLVNKGFNTEALKILIQKLDDEHEFQVSKLVILGHHFESKAQREIDEAMKNYSNKKSIPVDVVVRY